MPYLFAEQDWKRNGLALLFGKSKSENHLFLVFLRNEMMGCFYLFLGKIQN